jgi:acetyltransferase-like isoleucine patch superfamily enzyme
MWKFLFLLLDKFISLRKGSFYYRLKVFFYRKRFKSFGNNPTIYFPIIIESKENVSIGSNVSINSFVHIWGTGEVIIGDNVMIAAHACITSATHDYNKDEMNKMQVLEKVTIMDDVWIGTGALILSGLTIGKGSVIGAGAVITKDVPERSIVIGNPARIYKYRP